MLVPLILSLCLLAFATRGSGEQAAPIVQQQDSPSVDEVLGRMKAHDEWQERYLLEYRAQRKFYAANQRFNEVATLEVRTTFRRPDFLESQVLRAEGSKLIRERVFNKILEAENETRSMPARQEIAIEPANYSFSLLVQ